MNCLSQSKDPYAEKEDSSQARYYRAHRYLGSSPCGAIVYSTEVDDEGDAEGNHDKCPEERENPAPIMQGALREYVSHRKPFPVGQPLLAT
jgi:hypothetical protein